MSHSFHEVNYTGAFTYQQGDKLQSFRITHAVFAGEEYERLEYLDGDKKDVIRKGHDFECIHPGHHLIRFLKSDNNSELIGQNGVVPLSDYYSMLVVGKGKVAGRAVVLIDVMPKDRHRFGYRLSLDEDTALLLRSELMGINGKVLERFQFVDITVDGPIDPAYFDGAKESYHPYHIATQHQSLKESSEISPKRLWRVDWLPKGFTPVAANRDENHQDMATYTDGLAVFSVFLEKHDQPLQNSSQMEGRAQRGATVAYSRALILGGQPHRVTVVGEVPQATARQVAQSVVQE